MLKEIKGYENLYSIDELGNIFGLIRQKYLKTHIGRGGYLGVVLTDSNHKQHHEYVHILLAKTFIDNPLNFPIINHKDENKLNNSLDNLEWCSYQYNNTYNNIHKIRGKSVSETIYNKGGSHNKGKKLSEEQKSKISNSLKGHKFGNNQYTKNKIK